MDEPPIRGYRFGEFTLDLGRRRLSRDGADPLPLSGRAFDVLVHLVQQRDRMVTKRELMDAVWPRVVVEENNLTQAISSLRKALGDSRESPRFIVTVAGRGYQFVADVRPDKVELLPAAPVVVSPTEPAAATPPVAPTPEPAPPLAPASPPREPSPLSRRTLMLGLGGIAAAALVAVALRRRAARTSALPASIAVLPFKPLYGGTRNEAVEIGVAELLINRLSTLPGVVVRPLSSTRRFGTPDSDPLQAGRDLGVDTVVDGYVQIQQDQVRLTARLLDVDSGAALWAGNFTERLGDFFAVQDSLATQLVTALAIDLPAEARRKLLARATGDPEAWQLFANARYQVERRDAEGLRRGREYFAAATQRDPQFALAFAGLSEAWAMAAVFGLELPVEAFGAARRSAERSLQLDPRLPQGHVALGHVFTQYDRDFEAGRRQYDEAIALAPSHGWARTYLALNATQRNQLPQALDSIRQAQQLEPASLPFMALGGFVQYFAREFDASFAALRRIVESAPGAALPRQFYARVLLVRGDAAGTVRLLEGRNDPAPGSLSNLGRAYARLGRVAEARAQIAQAEALGQSGFGVGFDLALMHLELGEREPALAALERAVDDHSQMLGYLNVEPALDPIRSEPRFRAVSRRLGLG